MPSVRLAMESRNLQARRKTTVWCGFSFLLVWTVLWNQKLKPSNPAHTGRIASQHSAKMENVPFFASAAGSLSLATVVSIFHAVSHRRI